jgi:nucleotidyltransferase/DNA polymerase involved in DNA repair
LAYDPVWQVRLPHTTCLCTSVDERISFTGFIAKKLCPHLIFVKMSHGAYSEMSKKVMDIFRRYDPTMQVAGCDEGYLKYVKVCPLCGPKTYLRGQASRGIVVNMI